jgi:hypothetical protein
MSMDPLLVAIVSRIFERVLVVAAGALAIYLGYRLFMNMPEHDKSSGKFVLPGGISIFLSRVGPGIFFSLFGAVVIGLSFHYGIKYDEDATATVVAVAATAGTEAQQAPRRTFSGIAPSTGMAGSPDILRDRNEVLVAVTALNKAAAALPAGMASYDRRQILDGIRDAKLRLLQSVWDAEHWGEFETAAAWLRDNGDAEPPPQLAEAVGNFRAGAPAPTE